MARRRTRRSLALLPALALAAGCAHSIAPVGEHGELRFVEPGKLTTCTHLPYEPFQFEQGGRKVGFDVDLVDLVARDLGLQQKLLDAPFEGIQSGEALNMRQCDLAAAAMTITPTRQRNMAFSDPYFDADQALLVRAGAPHPDLASLRGKVLGVQLGTTGEEYARAHQGEFGYRVRQFEDVALLESSVQNGTIDAGINDNGVVRSFAKNHPDTRVTAIIPTGEKYGIAVQKQNVPLRQRINATLAEAKRSGEYDRIYRKWIGAPPPK